MEKFILRSLCISSFVLLLGCSNAEEKLSDIDGYRIVSGSFQETSNAEETKLTGMGTLAFNAFTPSVNSARSIRYRGALDHSAATLDIIAYTSSSLIRPADNSGIRIRISRNGTGIKLDIGINGGTMTEFKNIFLDGMLFNQIDLVFDIHNEGPQAYVLVWPSTHMVYAPASSWISKDASTMNQLSNGQYVGLIVEQATINGLAVSTAKTF